MATPSNIRGNAPKVGRLETVFAANLLTTGVNHGANLNSTGRD